MFKTCSICGKIHDINKVCRRQIQKKDTKASKFRNAYQWKKKRDSIKTRDKHLCRVCLRGKYETNYRYTYEDLEVHHIVLIEEDYSLSFGAENANFFYQPEPYITGNKIYYIYTSIIPKYACLYIKIILEATFSSKYSFSDGMIPNKIKRKTIKLLIDKNENPGWDYMEQYMMNLLKDTRDNLNHFKYV